MRGSAARPRRRRGARPPAARACRSSRSVPCAEVGSPTRSAGPIERSADALGLRVVGRRVRAVDHELRDPRPAKVSLGPSGTGPGERSTSASSPVSRGGPQCRDCADPGPADAYGARPAPSRLGDGERHVVEHLARVPGVVGAAVAAQVERERRPAVAFRERRISGRQRRGRRRRRGRSTSQSCAVRPSARRGARGRRPPSAQRAEAHSPSSENGRRLKQATKWSRAPAIASSGGSCARQTSSDAEAAPGEAAGRGRVDRGSGCLPRARGGGRSRAWSAPGPTRGAPACTGAAGSRTAPRPAPSSTILPRYMTATRSAMWRTTDMSWLTNR